MDNAINLDIFVTLNQRTNDSLSERLVFIVLLAETTYCIGKSVDVSLRTLTRYARLDDIRDTATFLKNLAAMGIISIAASPKSKPTAPHYRITINDPEQWHTIDRAPITGGETQ